MIQTTLELKNFGVFLDILSTAKGKIVCIDLDNTLVNVNDQLKAQGYSIRRYPAKLPHNFWKTQTGIKILRDAQPIPETIALINLFRGAGAEIIFGTARDIEHREITEKWLARHCLEGEVYYVPNKAILEADIYVDDSPQEIERLVRIGAKVIVPEWPYNRQITDRNIISYRRRGFQLDV